MTIFCYVLRDESMEDPSCWSLDMCTYMVRDQSSENLWRKHDALFAPSFVELQ